MPENHSEFRAVLHRPKLELGMVKEVREEDTPGTGIVDPPQTCLSHQPQEIRDACLSLEAIETFEYGFVAQAVVVPIVR